MAFDRVNRKVAALLLQRETRKREDVLVLSESRRTRKPIKDARTARWPGTMAQLLKMGAGTALLVLSVKVADREYVRVQTPCCGRRGEIVVAFQLLVTIKSSIATPPRTERDVCESVRVVL